MNTPSRTHVVLIPSYNTGPQLHATVAAARAVWSPVWVVVDGSTDGTAEGLLKLADAPIQTVFIDTRSPDLGKGWPLWRLPPLPIEFSVRLGRRFEPRADHESLVREVEAYFAAGVVAPAAGPVA